MSSESETPPRSSPEVVSEPSKKSKKRKNDAEEIEVDLTLPEPPSKKAKRLLKKGKPLPVKKDSDDEASDKEGGDDDKKDKDKKKERSPYGVWIGNLRFSVTKHDLRDWLLENSGGSITADLITRIKLPSSRQKGARQAEGEAFENKGYAYVDFSTYEATIAAIALSETEWHRRKLLIKDAKSFEGRPAKPKPGADEAGATTAGEAAEATAEPKSTTKKIFVGNLSFQTTEDDLHELFGTCGEIEWLKVAQFEDTGKCKGYAWVKFKEAEAADWAVKGFVKIKEVEETEEDFMDVDDKEEQEDERTKEQSEEGKEKDDDESGKKRQKKAKPQKEERKVKTRKWWVNTLHGRRLKIEAAEDDQTRYKKRYGGKGAAAAAATPGGQRENPKREAVGQKQRPQASNHKHNNDKRRRDHDDGGDRDTGASTATPKEAEVSNFRQDISVARLTGAPVKPQGKKTTFE
ncbi:Nucleolar protein 13 [Diaporthe australafricana]|uniref:Nucleolar protein 13 n=1 Tax=Diaporthe australafricana TaxID=127596 RepID=A0ABR3XFT5_9PEZI